MQKRTGLMMLAAVLVGAVLSFPGAGLVAAADKAPTPKAETPKGPRAIIKTKFGDIEVKFYQDIAPKHVENFMKLAKEGFYNGTIFHRVIPGFMIQGGDPNTKDSLKKDNYGQGGPGYTVKAEFSDIPHKRGILSMARAADPDTAGSQFFIVVEESRHLDRKYTAFGEVTKGIGVADKIANLPRVECNTSDPKGLPVPTPAGKGPCQNPLERVEMAVTIVE
ncbi:MAG: peptidyl-prolyl cis-trans isomerase [Nitrospira sp.]|nr:MAG: peptidyl-prolyl cis-trans isomerase [Nitrospira sp.]